MLSVDKHMTTRVRKKLVIIYYEFDESRNGDADLPFHKYSGESEEFLSVFPSTPIDVS